MKSYVPLFFIGLLVLSACKKNIFKPDAATLIQGESFKNGVLIDGHEFDSLIIEGCSFENIGLEIRNADYVTVRNCSFKDINGNGIAIGFGGAAENVNIENCTISNIGFNGINSHESAIGGTISGCTIESVGLSEIGSAMAQAHHGIYWKAGDVRIVGNTIHDVVNNGGNGISIRSDGFVERNTIYNCAKAGVTYYSDHPPVTGFLFIQNNMIYDNEKGAVRITSNGNLDNQVDQIFIRFNTLLQNDGNNCMYVDESFESVLQVVCVGNIMISNKKKYIYNSSIMSTSLNVRSDRDIGFVDFEGRNLHIIQGSIAEGYCSGYAIYPISDFDLQFRTKYGLDAGADEIY